MPQKITVLTRKAVNVPAGFPVTFTVGEPVVDGGHVVTEILYCRDGFSKGAKGRRSAYVVKFASSNESRVVPEDEMVDMAVANVEQAASIPELPE